MNTHAALNGMKDEEKAMSCSVVATFYQTILSPISAAAGFHPLHPLQQPITYISELHNSTQRSKPYEVLFFFWELPLYCQRNEHRMLTRRSSTSCKTKSHCIQVCGGVQCMRQLSSTLHQILKHGKRVVSVCGCCFQSTGTTHVLLVLNILN